MTAMHTFPLEPAPIQVSDEVLDDLRARLALTRPPLACPLPQPASTSAAAHKHAATPATPAAPGRRSV